MERLKDAGLTLQQVTVPTLHNAKQWLQDNLGSTPQEAADLVSAAGRGGDGSLSADEAEETPEPGEHAVGWETEAKYDEDGDVDIVGEGERQHQLLPIEDAPLTQPPRAAAATAVTAANDRRQQVLCLLS